MINKADIAKLRSVITRMRAQAGWVSLTAPEQTAILIAVMLRVLGSSSEDDGTGAL